ncbi:hypothetical protein DASB73_033290 [Starmerella bacillaris]|uniref:N-acetyltransferase domain-containing protein n=1 Tax=Starmerella bacillaris TaxID=1247836 RepID=A0AAV5RLF4_STABA|nr:hypothetical protein DASB73_033290 [Starmerella bacillaris]
MFRDITNNKQLVQESLRHSFSHWGHALTFEQYVAEGEKIGKILADDNLTVRNFALVANDKLLASCEVLERPLYCGGGKYAVDNGVASVFVPDECRRKGYAELLINSVVNKYRSSENQLSLWSDVADYYSRCGFRLLDGVKNKVHPTVFVNSPGSADINSFSSSISFLGINDMTEIIELHRKQVFALADAGEGNVIVPNAGSYGQLQNRILIEEEYLNMSPTTEFGAVVKEDGELKAWMSWGFLLSYKKLIVMGTSGSSSDIAKLLIMASSVASRIGLHVHLFETTLVGNKLEDVLAELKKLGADAELKGREGSWPMVISEHKWVGAGGYGWY